jgi:hypothetical protein
MLSDVLEIAGFTCVTAAMFVLFGLGAALLAGGCALLLIGFGLGNRR